MHSLITRRGRENLSVPPVFMVIPVAFVVAFFVAPMAVMFATSFATFDRIKFTDFSRLTLDNYARLFSDPFYRDVLIRSVRLSAIAAVVTLLLGYPCAYHLTKVTGRWQALLVLLYVSPLLVSIVIRTYGWTLILSPSGLVNRFLLTMGWVKEPVGLMWNEFGVLVGLVHVFLGYMILPLYAALVNIDPNISRAAHSLGARPFVVFRTMTLPLSFPGVLAGCVLVFSLAMASFVTPWLLGGARVRVFALLAYEQIISFLNWPFGAAISFTLLFVTVLIIIVYQRLGTRWEVISG